MAEPLPGPESLAAVPTAQLLEAARDGDAEALGALLDRFRGLLRALAGRNIPGRINSRLDPSDVVQETCLNAYRGFHQFTGHGETELVSWLATILDNKITDACRQHLVAGKRSVQRQRSLDDSRAAPPPPVDAKSTPSRQAMRAEDSLELARALDHLPPDQREAIYLKHFGQLSLAQLADHFGRSPEAVAGLLKRGLEQLRRQMRIIRQGTQR